MVSFKRVSAKVALLFLSAIAVFEHTQSTFIVKRITKSTNGDFFLLSNGSIQISYSENLRVCSIGKGYLFVEDEHGECHDEKEISISYGTTNQISTENTRTNFANKDFTVLEEAVLDLDDLQTAECIAKALTPGKDADYSEVKTVGNYKNETVSGFKLYVLAPNATISFVGTNGWCCACTTGGCGVKIVSGLTGERAICGSGPGTSLIVYPGGNRKDNCTISEGVCIGGNKNGIEAYLPTPTTKLDSYIIGVSYSAFYHLQATTTAWDMENTRFSNKRRKKRFVEWLALAIATAATIGLAVLTGMTSKAFAAVDRNFAKTHAQLATDRNDINENIRSLYILSQRQIFTDVQLRTLEKDSEKYNELLGALSSKVVGIEQFLLYSVIMLQRNKKLTDQEVDTLKGVFSKNFPNFTIIETANDEFGITVFAHDGNIVSGDGRTEYCDAENCQLSGEWKWYTRRGSVRTVRNPFLTVGTCGIYFSDGCGDNVLYGIGYASTFEDALDILEKENCPHVFVNRMTCTKEYPSENTLLNYLEDNIKYTGLRANLTADQAYYLGCESGNLTTLKKRGVACDTVVRSEQLKTIVDSLRPLNWTYEQTQGKFFEAMGDAVESIGQFFGNVGKGFVKAMEALIQSLIPVDIISILIILYGILLFGLCSGGLFLYKQIRGLNAALLNMASGGKSEEEVTPHIENP